MFPRQLNTNPPKTRKKTVKRKSSFEKLPLKAQLRAIMEKFDDPLGEVISILDPYYNSIIRPEVRQNKNIPTDPNYGLFRVIFWIRENKEATFHTKIIEAKNGYDARMEVEDQHIGLHSNNLMKVVGVECVIVPKKYINQINNDFPFDDQTGLIKIQAEMAKEEIIKKLALFKDDEIKSDLTEFLKDD